MMFRLALLSVLIVAAPLAPAEDLLTREGRHLRLTSDVIDADLLNDLVQSVDEAVPQWVAFWNVPTEKIANWKIDGYLMRNVDRFRRDGSLPENVPHFGFGFSSPKTIWIREQPSRYYNRHLTLHETVHALAFEFFGACGPTWYMEGTAELLATHRDRPTAQTAPPSLLAQQQNAFRISEIPRSSDEAPFWGRFALIEKRRNEDRLPTLKSVLNLPTDLAGDVESYGWAWAAAVLLTRHEETRPVFIAAARNGSDQSPAFTAKFFTPLRGQWPVIEAQWRLLLHDLEYGFDANTPTAKLSTADPRYDGREIRLEIVNDNSWQSSGVWFPPRTRLQVTASGTAQFEPADASEILTSEPSGITSHWHRGSPVGQLQVCVLPIATAEATTMTNIDVQPAINLDAWPTKDDNNQRVYAATPITITQPSWVLWKINATPGATPEDKSAVYQVTLRSSGQ